MVRVCLCGCDGQKHIFLGPGRGLGVSSCVLLSAMSESGTEGSCFLERCGPCGPDSYGASLDPWEKARQAGEGKEGD